MTDRWGHQNGHRLKSGYKYAPMVLKALVRCGSQNRNYIVAECAGVSTTTYWFCCEVLSRSDLVQVRSGHTEITERGKIALAIWEGKQAAARARRFAKCA